MSRLTKLFSVAVFSIGIASGADAASYSFSTADSPFHEGVFNQGWWNSDDISNPSPTVSGKVDTGLPGSVREHRSYFTFDLSGFSLAANEQITFAGFAGNSGQVVASGFGEQIGLFDVSTSAAVLNEHLGTTAGVFDDLGSGKSYGKRSFLENGSFMDFEIFLNEFAIADILTAQGGYFSIGIALLTLDGDEQQSVFGGSGDTPFTLNIETQISAVPLPAAFPLYGAGLAVLGFFGWRKRRKAAA